MDPLLSIKIALRSLIRNKLRALLTMLGIIIGVGAVITTVAIGSGAQENTQKQIASLGTNLLMIVAGSSSMGGARGGAGTLTTLVEDDARAIIRDCPSISRVCPSVRNSASVVFGNQNWFTSIQGVTDDFLEIKNWKLESGSYFTTSDQKSTAKVCILGKTVVDQLFAGGDPIGQTIRIKKFPFTVIGVLESKGQSSFGQDQDDLIIAPLTTVQKKIMGITYLNMILASTINQESLYRGEEEITTLLRARHRIQPGAEDDFSVRNQREIAQRFEEITSTLRALLLAVASVSLVVGGIGIMNIMLVTVTERTKEIGIRMAIGARSRDILQQFLVEAFILSTLGGMFGILLGWGGSQLIGKLAGWPALISLPAVIVSVLFSGAVGIFFGYYPAYKASQLDPIEALRFE